MVGDKLKFTYAGHNVLKMSSAEHFEKCDFTGAQQLAGVGESPYTHTITEEDRAAGALFLACGVGSHCMNQQKVAIRILQEPPPGGSRAGIEPRSTVSLGLDATSCNMERGNTAAQMLTAGQVPAKCSDPIANGDGSFFRSCLSASVTLTPGGVINRNQLMYYPFPTDRRVLVGLRTWEFVTKTADEEIVPVPVNQLYVHHLSGNVILGQGSEGIRRKKPDAPYKAPYGMVSGDEMDWMIFHLLDTRGVADWLECIECRCFDSAGQPRGEGVSNSSMSAGGADGSGGVNCCFNCTTSLPLNNTITYYMRYNVSYRDLYPTEVVDRVGMLTADISPVVGKALEYDVPSWQHIPLSQRLPGNDKVQHLVREGPFKELFHHDFFGKLYSGGDQVALLRCVGHAHVAALGMWIEDATTGKVLCTHSMHYGTQPEEDKDYLIRISVEDMDPPQVIAADQPVRIVADYNATEFHTGVMGMFFVFYASHEMISQKISGFQAEVCVPSRCEALRLPKPPAETVQCKDELSDHPACKFGGVCDCPSFVTAPESTGCGGVYKSTWGDVVIDTVCAAHCGSCAGSDELAKEEMATQYEAKLQSLCKYPTEDCVSELNNLLACSLGRPEYLPSCPGSETGKRCSLIGGSCDSTPFSDCSFGRCICQRGRCAVDGECVPWGVHGWVREMMSKSGLELFKKYSHMGSAAVRQGQNSSAAFTDCKEAATATAAATTAAATTTEATTAATTLESSSGPSGGPESLSTLSTSTTGLLSGEPISTDKAAESFPMAAKASVLIAVVVSLNTFVSERVVP
eukprot:TRINITY_DN10677_c0_g1_i1.p1 TRINITY_DN10677_c0_g1~~TRINITY_DN10677_c0_g1_i1.p1  ORF type:complete len:800 (-),score=118.75 TRINITY_DN10677_c0_g1_i1:7-2406(-)